MLRPCLDCGRAALRSRCQDCARIADARRHNPAYDTPQWRRFRASTLARHRARFGEWCPGDERHAAHATRDLTLDHVTPLAAGGRLLDAANIRVVCRAGNSAKGARQPVTA